MKRSNWSDENLALIAQDVTTHLGKRQEQSISHLLQELRQYGINGRRWRGIGTLSNFEAILQDAGFSLRRERKGNNGTTHVYVYKAAPRRRLNIGHKNGGMVIDITHMGHETNRCGAYWFFKGRCEWNDGSHKRDPDHSYEFSPANLCYGDNSLPGAQDDLAKALDAINAYLERAGRWDAKASAWVPYYKRGLEEVRL